MADTDDDPVVQEVDVFLSKQLMEQLFLFQYPVRPAHFTYDDVDHLSVKMKPKQQKVEMELAMNTACDNYSRSKGEQIAINVDGKNPNPSEQFYASGYMDKQTISSQKVAVDNSRYTLGLFKDNELHLNPIKGIIQMRASFSYLDKEDARKRVEEDDAHDDEEEAKPVTVKFARHESEDAKARRLASYEYLKRMEEEEKWVVMQHHSKYESMADAERVMLSAQQANEVSEFYISQDEYLTKLIEKPQEKPAEKPALPNNLLSMSELKSMSVSDQVKALLLSAKVIRFSQLLTYLPKGCDVTTVLRSLQQVALLVQGVWVVKSEVLYPEDTKSSVSGVSAKMLQQGRDYIMWRFNQDRFLVRKDITAVIKLQSEDVKDILEKMSHLRARRGWEFKHEYDAEFVSRHPEVVQRQQLMWKSKFEHLRKVLNVIPADIKAAAQCMSPPKRQRRESHSRRRSGGGLSDQSDNELSERRRHGSGMRAAQPSEEPMETNNGNLHNHTTDHLTPETRKEMQKELVLFIREKLQSRTVLKLSDLRTGLSLKLMESPAGHALGKGVPDNMLLKVIRSSGALEIPPAVTKLQEQLFVNHAMGDRLDPIRSVVVNMLASSNRIIVKAVRNTVNEQDDGSKDPVSEADVRKVVKEYCTSKGSNWILKGTLP